MKVIVRYLDPEGSDGVELWNMTMRDIITEISRLLANGYTLTGVSDPRTQRNL